MTAVPLTRRALAARDHGAAATPPIRIVHLGLGNFFRAHQAWFTARASDASEWGIAAFAGRSGGIADVLAQQDGLYTLVERGATADRVEMVSNLVETNPGDDVSRLARLVSDDRVALITLTVTESGYRFDSAGRPDPDDRLLAADIQAIRRESSDVVTIPGRLLFALDARRRAGASGIALVPCDNIPGNGDFLRRGLTAAAAQVDSALASWITENVSFVSTSVDRITPRIDTVPPSVATAGWIDASPVVTEPFADWVLSGDFPAGRPRWEDAGARFVDDVQPWEHRKLWLLNGAHSILAFAGLRRGLQTVAEAIADDECRALVEAFWREAVALLPPGIEHEQYRADLLVRFSNPRIEHRLDQIAGEATTKARFRFAAVAERTLAAGREPRGSLRALASWIEWTLAGQTVLDSRADEVARAVASEDSLTALTRLVSPQLAATASVLDGLRAGLVLVTPPIDLVPHLAEPHAQRSTS